ncbi:MAG: TetR/AcrR family transcriptional regulator [Bacterioplanes sp.]|nr:TetR/AcrR family transcriptional regulator [Bacterioplanes sp.]
MPKKPFSAEEITAQCHRIMDSAATVTANVGFHHLSMRNMALELGMTASNIYNYFPSKERLFLQTRLRGFELLLGQMKHAIPSAEMPMAETSSTLHEFANHLIAFAQRHPGYYQLMFQPPILTTLIEHEDDQRIAWQIERRMSEWQEHVSSLLLDALPRWRLVSAVQQQRAVLFMVSSLHGLIDAYRHRALTELLQGVELIPQDVVAEHVAWLLQGLQQSSSVTSL